MGGRGRKREREERERERLTRQLLLLLSDAYTETCLSLSLSLSLSVCLIVFLVLLPSLRGVGCPLWHTTQGGGEEEEEEEEKEEEEEECALRIDRKQLAWFESFPMLRRFSLCPDDWIELKCYCMLRCIAVLHYITGKKVYKLIT